MTGYVILIQIILFTFNYVNCTPRLDPMVETKLGLIKGIAATDGLYSMFMGIPYGKVDSDNPFGASKPYPAFDKPFEAYDDMILCPQIETYNKTISGTIDCLNLNIYVPNIANSQNKIPVMVYIHGGFFKSGISGRYQAGPKYLVKHDVILVTINYRVGPYGFMCLDIPEIPGNQGLKDQALALKWIKENIYAFGGDPNKVTVFGVSAGGHSIDFHLFYGDKKLFNNAILQSGSALASTVYIDPDKEAPLKISEHLGYSASSLYDAISFLSLAKTDDVLTAVEELNLIFKPCVEKSFDGVEAYITKSWTNTITADLKDKSIMTGFNEYEKIVSFASGIDYDPKDYFLKALDDLFNFNEVQLIEMSNLIHNFYLESNEDSRTALVNFDSDFTYIHPIQRSIERYIESKARNVYYYMFSYVGNRNNGQILNNVSVDGAAHSDEVGYLFDPQFMTDVPNERDQLMIDRMTTLWTNFAKYGDPTPQTSEILPVKWLPLSKDHYNYLKINADLTLESRPLEKRMAFWNLFYALNEKYQKGYEDI